MTMEIRNKIRKHVVEVLLTYVDRRIKKGDIEEIKGILEVAIGQFKGEVKELPTVNLTLVDEALVFELEWPKYIDINKVATEIILWLQAHGTELEKDFTIGEDPYKAVYRAMSLLFNPAFQNWKESEISKALGGEAPSLEQAAEIFKEANTFFAHVVKNNWDLFVSMYNFHREAYE